MASELPKARITTVKKWEGVNGYGFVVNNKKERGYFKIKAVEGDSPAAAGGILAGDYIIEVNENAAGMNEKSITLSECRHPQL